MPKAIYNQAKCQVLRENIKEVLRLYIDENWSSSKIALKYKIYTRNGQPNRNVVLGFFNRIGVRKGSHYKRPIDDQDQQNILKLYEDKAGSIDTIARMYGICTKRVKTILKERGAKITPKPKTTTAKKVINADIREKIVKRNAFGHIRKYDTPMPKSIPLPLPKQKIDTTNFYEASVPKDGYCKYPVGDNPFKWCNQKAEKGSSYCQKCQDIVYARGAHIPFIRFKGRGMLNKFVDRDV